MPRSLPTGPGWHLLGPQRNADQYEYISTWLNLLIEMFSLNILGTAQPQWCGDEYLQHPTMTEQKLDMWKVFVPYDILMSPSGFICGQVNRQLNLVYVSDINDDMSMTCDDIVGYWASDGETQTLNESRNCQHFVYLNKSSAGELLCQCLTDSRPSLCSCVIYRPEDFVRSYFVTCREDLLNHEGRTSQRSFIQTIVTYIQGSRRKKTCENTRRSLFSPFYVMVQFVIWIVGLLYQLRVVVDNR